MTAAICCPDANVLALGLCQRCYQKLKARRRGVKGPDTSHLEAIAAGHEQRKSQASNDRFRARQERATSKRTVSKGWAAITRKYRYGLSEAEYGALLEEQDGKCAICRELRQLYVDHCHTTKAVRGLLCPGCNTAVGFMEKRAHLHEAVKRYIGSAK